MTGRRQKEEVMWASTKVFRHSKKKTEDARTLSGFHRYAPLKSYQGVVRSFQQRTILAECVRWKAMTKGVFTMSQTLGQYKQEQEKHWHITPALFRWISQQFCNFFWGSEYYTAQSALIKMRIPVCTKIEPSMHINWTSHFFQKHFNEIPKLHGKATIPPVVM